MRGTGGPSATSSPPLGFGKLVEGHILSCCLLQGQSEPGAKERGGAGCLLAKADAGGAAWSPGEKLGEALSPGV